MAKIEQLHRISRGLATEDACNELAATDEPEGCDRPVYETSPLERREELLRQRELELDEREQELEMLKGRLDRKERSLSRKATKAA